ncbi:dipeptidase [Pelagibacterium halotolerans]|uniref:Microsomal dipeptidase n=1 Tax=Pelagibacterium halotolerans (strain DSM 22347 / JCM 15775 / CGMCC 1.7692 / B2) TaxID=1082931 RepID=G4REN0_PELHB|nr:dipeptidase [Pelagibacterium halotolerans]AEQ50880.1 Microsomal dipeptidase [Pelagibacterium halotolerans B2]QJR19213.1 membrane dipeptidase [Pelagibacterium halotolerans]SDZ98829.1 membrane dipeptidase [Pelagibacterium halotolerans]
MTDADQLHRQSIVIDGLQCSDFNRELFEEARRGGVTAINCSAVLWENFNGGIDYVSMWKRLIRDNSDIVIPVRSVADIRHAKDTGKLGIIIGWQNTSPIEDRLDYVEIFKDLGVGIMQLTYNTQNYSGAGYLEARDSGLTGFGREVVSEMNRVGVLCDLSHVGERTALDAIAHSQKPCAITHCLPRGLRDVPRNKSDEVFKACAEKGGVVGTSLFAPGLADGNEATVASVIDALSYTLDLVGEDHVAIGTDFSLNRPRPGPWLLWANKDKGTARTLTEFGSVKISKPLGIRRIDEFPNLTAEMVARGWSQERIGKILGGNWLRVLDTVWG